MNLLKVKNLNIHFKTKKGLIHAVRNVSFEVEKSETLGIVGESGCGKSITNMAIMGLLDDNAVVTADELSFDGVDLQSLNEKSWQQIRGGEISMIFQDAMSSLNPCYTVENQIEEVLLIHEPTLKKEERKQRVERLLTQVGIPAPKERMKSYPHELSGGMAQRVMIAMAIASGPKLLIADEPTTALDVTVQQQILDLLIDIQKETGMAVIFISHDLAVVKDFTRTLQVMYAGEVIEKGPTDEIISHPRHPYTYGLLQSIPSFTNDINAPLYSIKGMVPDLASRPEGCQFRERCNYASNKCGELPKLIIHDEHSLRCIHPLNN
ncbi:ABC transporter ATP-binding protein [Halobacteriovorax vibrionivorans]|uniref:ABC transporter ATP-binding protein n=1 Tax=Halobacteriovorax vibrionivorans TaxID=2152716 RepID=A0ABY0IE71_9BACT|nr:MULTISPECIES: ABC transporter ATP-binding protein [Halobacteriovorax]RZF21248.1 ABC transporter ATP-binding protein [Halobacteriovorax vibrionivorans]TGD47994.1 ABC transporter ATP-binding protein [Halobacteriovorax sp. Y22]